MIDLRRPNHSHRVSSASHHIARLSNTPTLHPSAAKLTTIRCQSSSSKLGKQRQIIKDEIRQAIAEKDQLIRKLQEAVAETTAFKRQRQADDIEVIQKRAECEFIEQKLQLNGGFCGLVRAKGGRGAGLGNQAEEQDARDGIESRS